MTGHKQTTDGGDSAGYATSYVYNLGGAMIEETYPSTRKVQNILDNNGDLSAVQSKENSSASYKTYVNDFTCTAAGAVSSLRLGNGKFESTAFNSRLQPTQIALGASVSDTSSLKLDYSYGDWVSGSIDATKNNGNIVQQIITTPTVGSYTGFAATQKYYYDSLNRIDDSTETIGGTQTWRQDFTYDRYGNRNFNHTNTSMPASFSNPAVTDPTVSTSNNRITSSGYNYDASGNTTYDAGLRKFTYDAENKQVKAESTNSSQTVTGTLGEYSYDGDGKRVKKYVPSTGETTIFVYDAAGKEIAEYSTVVASSTNAKVAYLTNDHLGSPRINTDVSGTVISRHDYHPFGGEISTSQRSAHPEYGDDTVRKQFTGYERDGETDLDFAQARTYGNQLGRFTSPDPVAISDNQVVNPQFWNLYAYVGNNPINAEDSTGMIPVQLGQHSDSQIDKLIGDAQKNLQRKGISESDRAKNQEAIQKLQLEKEGNRIVGAMIAAGGDELKGMQLKDITLSTNPSLDIPSNVQDNATGGDISKSYMFVVEGYSTQIFINTESQGYKIMQAADKGGSVKLSDAIGFELGEVSFADLALDGATSLRHEKAHRDSEVTTESGAHTIQKNMLEKFGPTAFKNKDYYRDAVLRETRRINEYKANNN